MMPPAAVSEVTLLAVPVDLWRRASAHQEAIQREFDIIRASEPETSIPNRLFALMEDFDARFGGAKEATWDRMLEATGRGERFVDLKLIVPPEAATAARQLAEILAEVDVYCRQGEHLLTMATPAELVVFREWFLGEFSRQIDQGLEPLRWDPESVLPARAASAPASPVGGKRSDTIVVRGDLDLTSAGTLRDDIQARRNEGTNDLRIDLTGVGFMDSVGISLLVTTHQRLSEEGVTLRLVVPPRLRVLLELCGLAEVLHLEEGVAAR